MGGDPSLDQVLAGLIHDVPDFPEPGIVFKDISPLLADHDGFTRVVEELAAAGRDPSGAVNVDKVIGIEARGFILAAPVALSLGAGFVPVRKAGKLPRAVYRQSFDLEYGSATLEMHEDALVPGDRVLVVDDVLATGGTVEATGALIGRAGAEVTAIAVLIELRFLAGRDRLASLPLRSLLTV
jgi:adenine phosphoribosyltransferase